MGSLAAFVLPEYSRADARGIFRPASDTLTYTSFAWAEAAQLETLDAPRTMRAPARVFAIAALSTALACSWSAEWIISNTTAHPVRVRITAPRVSEPSGGYCGWEANDTVFPVVVRTSELDDWHEIGPGSANSVIDAKTCTVEFTLPAAHSTVFWQSRGTTHPSDEDEIFRFPISIRLVGNEGTTMLDGPHLDRLFQQRRNRRYILAYGRMH